MTYFSVDIETSGLVPGRHTLLSVGVVELTSGAQFYEVVQPERNARGVAEIAWDDDTLAWWKTQPEAWEHLFGPVKRSKPHDVAERLAFWVNSFPAPRTFVAWPASFDKPFLDVLFHDTGVTNPFDYRSVDIKSWICGAFGGDPSMGRDELPEAARGCYTEPELPHHALHDAIAQADAMRHLLAHRDAQKGGQ